MGITDCDGRGVSDAWDIGSNRAGEFGAELLTDVPPTRNIPLEVEGAYCRDSCRQLADVLGAIDAFGPPGNSRIAGPGVSGLAPAVDVTIVEQSAGASVGSDDLDGLAYTVPTGVTIRGVEGTLLVGTTAENGLVVESGALENLELNDFKIAIHAKVTATLTNITVKTSSFGVLADGMAMVKANRLTFVGTECADMGLRANDAAEIIADVFVATGSIAANVADQASLSISNGSLTDAPDCARIDATGRSLVVTNTQITGSTGIVLGGSQLDVTLENTTIADVTNDAIQGSAHAFRMTGGELRNNGRGGAELVGGAYTFTNVGIKGNPVFGIYLQSGKDAGTIAMRGCTISGNGGDGVYLFAGATGDFGTAASPGTNTFGGNAGVGINIDTSPSQRDTALPSRIYFPIRHWNCELMADSTSTEYARYSTSAVRGGCVQSAPSSSSLANSQ